MKRAVTTTFAAAGFLALLATAIVWSDPDPEKAIPTAESVTALGQEVRVTQHRPERDPLFGHPYKELCRDVGQNRSICR